MPGTTCDDGNLNTINDTWSANCTCAGTPTNFDCLGVSGGSAMPGTACDDGNYCTFNDAWTSNCECSGTPIAHDATFAYAFAEYCVSGSDPSPWVAEIGGLFSSNSINLVIDPITGELDLDASQPGTYQVTYTIGGNCPTSSDQQVTIADAFDATWAVPGPICSSSGPVDLNTLILGDEGGLWSGPGVTGSTFSPNGLNGAQSITYSVGSGTCHAELTQSVQVAPVPIANAGPDATVCGLEHGMHASSSLGNGSWTIPGGISTTDALSAPNMHITASTYGTFTLLWTVTNGACHATDSVVVTFVDPALDLWVDAGPDQQLAVLNTTALQGQASAGATLQWTLISGAATVLTPNELTTEVLELGLGDNVFVLVAVIGQCATASDTVVVHLDDLFIPEGYSPNGDGVNDRWEITGLEAFPKSTVQIFNRWGQEVYHSAAYANEWTGLATNGRALPDDTYFYVLNLSRTRAYNGHVIIKR